MELASDQRHHQEMDSQINLEKMLVCTKAQQQERKPRPPPEELLKCPRCDSANTKFCYYNNYSLSQPRYFCKSCRRYWTKGGTLRNVPVGGGCRKTKRPSSSSTSSSPSSSSPSSKRIQDQPLIAASSLTPFGLEPSDLTFALASLHTQGIGMFGIDNNNPTDHDPCFFPSSATPFLVDSKALGCGFLDFTHSDSYNLHHHLNAGDEIVRINPYESMSKVTPTEEVPAVPGHTVKRELINGVGEHQAGMDGSIGNIDLGMQGWNGVGSLWYGLINNTLL